MESEDFTLADKEIEEAARIIKAGGIIIYPTETVYGLGADISNRIAILKVYGAKRRSLDNPLSVAVKDLDQADELVYTNSYARKLYKAFLPGPLTMILKKKAILPKELTAGLDKIGIRIPDHPVALKLIELAGPITATSANVSGQPGPKTAHDAKKQLGGRVNFILDVGECKIGEPSTVVDISTDGKFEILREGLISREEIESALSKNQD